MSSLKFSGILIISFPFGVCGLIIQYIVDEFVYYFQHWKGDQTAPPGDLHLEDEHCATKPFSLHSQCLHIENRITFGACVTFWQKLIWQHHPTVNTACVFLPVHFLSIQWDDTPVEPTACFGRALP